MLIKIKRRKMSLKDYDKIKKLIDDIVGVDTMQGNNLKEAIKNYFETKPISVKLVSPKEVYTKPLAVNREIDKAMNEAMFKYTAKLKAETKALKNKGKFKGVCSITEG
jgi:predicted transcriptional regulator